MSLLGNMMTVLLYPVGLISIVASVITTLVGLSVTVSILFIMTWIWKKRQRKRQLSQDHVASGIGLMMTKFLTIVLTEIIELKNDAIEMKPNELYEVINADNIETTPNEVYGVRRQQSQVVRGSTDESRNSSMQTTVYETVL